MKTPWPALRVRWQQVQHSPMHEACASPCMSVCIMKTDADECWGCLRQLNEIADWSIYTPAEQRTVWQRIAMRIEQQRQGD
jgi:predicted Fe-S protein YdhL (DUF1289 family)